MLYVYNPSHKFNMIRILVLRGITKIWKKSTVVKKSKKYILHNNNAEKWSKNWQKKNNCPKNNQVTYPCFISNGFINFSELIRIFQFFLRFWKMNVTLRILNVYVPRLYITHKNFPGDWTNICAGETEHLE